ncbi:hypothetical protein QQF64_011540 [Cirrhinus molitorella]|uniref:Uncharacterized protein n=1 Tax=Cirrhinus molitorella TaxID=172907 RepID=A0ABR3M235_9TELE
MFHYSTAPKGCDLSPSSGLSVQRVYSDTADSLHTPTGSHAPLLLQSLVYHALITRRPSHYWSRSHTHLFFIGGVLPPARLL